MSTFFDLQTMMLDHNSLIHRQHCDVILLWFTDCLKWCHYSWYDVTIHCTEVCDVTILLFTYWNDVTIVIVMPLFFDSQTVMGRPYCLIFFTHWCVVTIFNVTSQFFDLQTATRDHYAFTYRHTGAKCSESTYNSSDGVLRYWAKKIK